MSDQKLPTLWIDDNEKASRRPMNASDIAYVPASSLDAANEALRVANEESERLKVMLGHMTRIVRQYEIPHGLFTFDNTRLVEAETALSPRPGAKESADE